MLTTTWHGRHTLDTHDGIQKFHHAPTPRIGGIALFGGTIFAWFLLPSETAPLFGQMLIAAIPAFGAGLIEDITKKVGVRDRLLATMFSGVIAWWLTGYKLTNVEVFGVDLLLVYYPISVMFTAFAVGGIANSVNIIDGFNGLAGGVVIICLAVFSMIASLVGDQMLALIGVVLISSVMGFLLLNFPFGKIFMGDGGAYLMGFLLGWVAVMLPIRNTCVSKWASLVVCGYPLIETLFSIVRRFLANASPGQPDCEHLHSLIKVKVVRKLFPDRAPSIRNGLVSPFCWLFNALFAGTAVFFYNNKVALIASFVSGACLYLLIYLLLAPDVFSRNKRNECAVEN